MKKEANYRVDEWVEVYGLSGPYAMYNGTHGLIVGELAARAMYTASGITIKTAAYRVEMYDKVAMIITPLGCQRPAPKRGNMDEPVTWYSMYETTGWLPEEMRGDY